MSAYSDGVVAKKRRLPHHRICVIVYVMPAASPISEGLRPYVTEADLVANAANYTEMQQDLTPEAEERVEAIKQHLLTVPLFHAFHNAGSIESMREHGLLSHAMSPNDGGMTYPLDGSIGLNEYTFASMGQLADIRLYGGNVLMINAGKVMLGNTVVTPHDIARHAKPEGMHKTFGDLDPAAQQRITDDYFKKMVTGKDWLEIIARRANASMQWFPYIPLSRYMELGEIKSRDPVHPSEFLDGPIDVGDPENGPGRQHALETQMLEKGLVLGHIAAEAYADPYGLDPRDIATAQRQVNTARACWERVFQHSFGSKGNFGRF